MPPKARIPSGISALDKVIDYYRLGDNVVWQVESLDDYRRVTLPFADQAIRDRRDLVYVRFGSHGPILAPRPGMAIESFDPRAGFDMFSAQIHRIIAKWGWGAFYIFDNLSSLVDLWATDELLANFFQGTCPYLFELDTLAYFALDREGHAHEAVARIRDTTQVLFDSYHIDGHLLVRPLKVWERYGPHMFDAYRVEGDEWIPLPESAEPSPLAHVTTAPWDTVYAQLKGPDRDFLAPVLRPALTRMLLGGDREIIDLADRYLTLDDLIRLREKVIGSGRIGGKATGMLLARAIVREADRDRAPEMPEIDEDSYFIGSNVFYTFLVQNDLFCARLRAGRRGVLSRDEFAELEARFLAGSFEEPLLRAFSDLLDRMGDVPLIIRSSSLLEDGFGNAFAGKYRSEFSANQGPREERLAAFCYAVKAIYASTLNPDALSYRRNRDLLESDEEMGILVQHVAGRRRGDLFYPLLAGVAFSRNLYAWTERIDPEAGMFRLVFGLGTRAVNRVASDYPRMVAVSHPELRPEIGEKIARYSQREVDVLDIKNNRFSTLTLDEVIASSDALPLHLLTSMWKDGNLSESVSRLVESDTATLILTFNRLIRETSLVAGLGRMLKAIEAAYGQPVDTEFAAEIDDEGEVHINLLQCRPLGMPGATGPVSFPEALAKDQVLFRSDRFIQGGVVERIRYAVVVDPHAYDRLDDVDIRNALPRIIARINRHARMVAGRILMMGPGRWGSGNPALGIGVGYADIDRVSVLVEMAREEAGHVPEVSYGTHFFQDLVEAQTFYVPVYPDQAEADYNEAFFSSSHNILVDLLPACAPYAGIVRVIDVFSVTGGRYARLVADPDTRRAVCYIA